ncbi:MAG TPA: hypothetical protein VFH54_12605 [Mycobacteriales bacterium]|nr:hypothetical protein [Mycobacteriales bacterium]
MPGNLTDTAEGLLLDHVNGTSAWTPTSPLKLRILQAMSSTPEATAGTQYSGSTDQTISFGAQASSSASSNVTCSFTGLGTGDIPGWEIYDTNASPKRIWFGVWSPKQVTAAVPASDQLTITSHGYSVGQKIVFIADPSQSTKSMPGGITIGTIYFVKTVVDANTITISTTSGGATLDITSDGAATVGVVKSVANPGDTFQVASGQLTDSFD